MKNYTLEIFLPAPAGVLPANIEPFLNDSSVTGVWLLCSSPVDTVLPAKVRVLPVLSLSSTGTFKQIAEKSSADFQLFIGKSLCSAEAG